MHYVETFPGAACFREFFGGISVEASIARVEGHAPKRLPSRRWTINTVMRLAIATGDAAQKKTRPALRRDGFSKYLAGLLL
jgi:hypothetical protein